MFDRAAAALATATVLLALTQPARAQTIDFNHVMSVAGSQATASQMMAKEALLIALDVDRESRLASLEHWNGMFERTLTGLRDGDDLLGLPAAATPEIAAGLEVADAHWQSSAPAFRAGVSAGAISAEQIETIVSHSGGLMEAFADVARRYAEESQKNRLTSMLVNAQLQAIRGTMLSQQMATEFLLIVYGHEADSSRAGLGGSISRFDEVLRNLTNGNLEQRLLPPPNDTIRDELARAQRVWEDEFRPVIRRALDGGQPPLEAASEMATANDRLLEHMKTLASLYVGL